MEKINKAILVLCFLLAFFDSSAFQRRTDWKWYTVRIMQNLFRYITTERIFFLIVRS